MSKLDHGETRHGHAWAGHAAVLALGLAIAGCSGDRLLGRSDAPTAGSSSPSLGDRISNLFGGKPAQPQVQAPNAPVVSAEDIECPTVTIRPGTSTYSVTAAGADPTAMTLRYQATFGQTARECRVTGTTLTIRVGVEGRLILGPAGSPGQFDVPLRYAVVQEGPEPKTVTTKLKWFTVVVPPGETNVPFTQVEDDLSFPLPPAQDLNAYVVYIGFDRAATKEPEKKKPTKKPPAAARRNPSG